VFRYRFLIEVAPLRSGAASVEKGKEGSQCK